MIKSKISESFIIDPHSHLAGDPFIISAGLTLSYEQFFGLVDLALPSLKKRYCSGDRIAILSANCPEFLILLFAMWRLKIVPVLLNTRWPASYISENLQKIDCRKIICASDFFSLNLKGIKKERLENIVGVYYRSVLLDLSDPIHFHPKQDGTIIFTSGSSGKPKAVLHTLRNHYYNALGSNQNIHLQPGDRWLLSLPLYHVGGLSIIFRTLLAKAAVVIPDQEASLEKSIIDQKITHLSLVTTQLYRLLQKQGVIPYLKKMKAILLGGGPIPFSYLKKCAKIKLPVYVSYGSTEMASQITTTSKSDGLKQWKTSGKLLPYRELKLNGDGEILVRGKTLCKGYLSSGRLKKITDKTGWFHSGDLGKLSKDGYLTVTGRKDNLFISGGENIQPEEIENYIRNIDGVEEVVVVPIPDPEFGQRPAAIIKWQKNKKEGRRVKGKGLKVKGKWTEDNRKHKIKSTKYEWREVREYLRKVLPGYKVPDYFLSWPKERSEGLKISRVAFQEWAEQELKTKEKIRH